ncbi:hypothetical protein Bca4012_084466 [Brassica carinata]
MAARAGTQREKSVSREALRVAVELVTGSIQALHDDIEGVKARFTVMEEDITLVKRTSVNAGAVGGTSAGRVDFPRPSRFNSVRDAKEVEKFLWQMEQYFDNLVG